MLGMGSGPGPTPAFVAEQARGKATEPVEDRRRSGTGWPSTSWGPWAVELVIGPGRQGRHRGPGRRTGLNVAVGLTIIAQLASLASMYWPL